MDDKETVQDMFVRTVAEAWQSYAIIRDYAPRLTLLTEKFDKCLGLVRTENGLAVRFQVRGMRKEFPNSTSTLMVDSEGLWCDLEFNCYPVGRLCLITPN